MLPLSAGARAGRVLLVLGVAAAVLSPTGTIAAPGEVTLGIHVAREGDVPTSVAAVEADLGRPVGLVNVFKNFSDTWLRQTAPGGQPTEEERLLAEGHALLVSWRATDPSDDAAARARRAEELAAGLHDATLRAMGDALAGLEGRVLLRFNWEMDQPAPQRQHIGTPAAFVAAWRRVHAVVSARAPQVEWVWAPRANAFNKDVGQQFWPGGAYVDLVGGSAVPLAASGEEGAWRPASEIFAGVHAFALERTRPLFVWVGVREKLRDPVLDPATADWADDPAWKATFVRDLTTLVTETWAGEVDTLLWYSTVAPSGFDVRYDTSPAAAEAFRTLACTPGVAGAATCGGGAAGGLSALPATVAFGEAGDTPFVADWDGDGTDDLVVKRFNRWIVDLDGDGTADDEVRFGRGDDVGVLVDLDRDGRPDPTVLRDGSWVADVGRDGAGGDRVVAFGSAADRRVVGDIDGDGWDDLVAVRDGVWRFDTDLDGVADRQLAFGTATDVALLADLTATAGDEPVVARADAWLVDGQHDGDDVEWRRADLGGTGVPVAGDVDGDGDDDGGWFRDGVWQFQRTRD